MLIISDKHFSQDKWVNLFKAQPRQSQMQRLTELYIKCDNVHLLLPVQVHCLSNLHNW
jgi:hypothetical protein